MKNCINFSRDKNRKFMFEKIIIKAHKLYYLLTLKKGHLISLLVLINTDFHLSINSIHDMLNICHSLCICLLLYVFLWHNYFNIFSVRDTI